MGTGRGGDASSVKCEPNFPLPYCTVVKGCPRPAGWVTYWLLQYMREYNVESPKQNSKRFTSICEDDSLCPSCYIIFL